MRPIVGVCTPATGYLLSSGLKSALLAKVTKTIDVGDALENPVLKPRLGSMEGHYDGGDFFRGSQLVFDDSFDFRQDDSTAATYLKNNLGRAGLVWQTLPAGSVSQQRVLRGPAIDHPIQPHALVALTCKSTDCMHHFTTAAPATCVRASSATTCSKHKLTSSVLPADLRHAVCLTGGSGVGRQRPFGQTRRAAVHAQHDPRGRCPSPRRPRHAVLVARLR